MNDTTPTMHERLTALVHGAVQGVGYRDFCSRTAYHLSHAPAAGGPSPGAPAGELSGYVRNLHTGSSVEVVAEGPRALLDAFLQQLYDGPGMAGVLSIDISWSAATHEFDRFTTRD